MTIKQSIFILGLSLGLLNTLACPSEPIPETDLKSSGVVIDNGESVDYTIDSENSSFLLEIKKTGGACDVFHAHIIEATQMGLAFKIDLQKPKESNLKIEIAASGLVNDEPELRKQFDSTKDAEINENDRKTIRVGMLDEQLDASNYPTMTFEIAEFAEILGEDQEVTVKATIKDLTSEFKMKYSASKNGDNIEVIGEGILEGTNHDMPSGFGSSCVQSAFPVHLKMILKPGVASSESDAGTIEEYIQKTFAYEGADCDANTGFDFVEPLLLKNCAACHGAIPTQGATIPLVNYDNWRVDSLRHQGEAVYLTSKKFIEQMPSMDEDKPGALTMPPSQATPLSTEEKATILAWIDAGAPPKKCEVTPQEKFTHVDKVECGSPNYKEDINQMIINNCKYCHDGSRVDVSKIDSYTAGLESATHPYYQPLNLWEASYLRTENRSMPPQGEAGHFFPGANTSDEEAFALFKEWIDLGYPEDKCE